MKLTAAYGLLLCVLLTWRCDALSWNIPGHMLSGAIAYQILQRENPSTIPIVRSVLEKNPWYETRWKPQMEKLPEAERDEMLFTLAARWADDIRTHDRAESHLPWHYVDFPFNPEGEPANIHAIEPPQENILTAIAENTQILRTGSDPVRRGVALSWLFHLIGDIHPPVHAVTLFSREYPKGDEGGTEACVRVAEGRAALSLHQFWDELPTSSNNTRTLRNTAIELRNRFPRTGLTELTATDPEIWAKESYEIATKITYQNGALRGTPKGKRRDCREVTDALVLPNGYVRIARIIADRRMMLAGYRLANLLQRISANSFP
jgi:S1/P1 Nuclease